MRAYVWNLGSILETRRDGMSCDGIDGHVFIVSFYQGVGRDYLREDYEKIGESVRTGDC